MPTSRKLRWSPIAGSAYTFRTAAGCSTSSRLYRMPVFSASWIRDLLQGYRESFRSRDISSILKNRPSQFSVRVAGLAWMLRGRTAGLGGVEGYVRWWFLRRATRSRDFYLPLEEEANPSSLPRHPSSLPRHPSFSTLHSTSSQTTCMPSNSVTLTNRAATHVIIFVWRGREATFAPGYGQQALTSQQRFAHAYAADTCAGLKGPLHFAPILPAHSGRDRSPRRPDSGGR